MDSGGAAATPLPGAHQVVTILHRVPHPTVWRQNISEHLCPAFYEIGCGVALCISLDTFFSNVGL